jgi:outer membrane lipoprotein SlyB
MNEREELAALRRLAELEQKAQGGPSFAERAGANIREIPRQVGLTARYGMDAFGQTALPDMLGLPEPQDANERVVGDASRVAVGAMGIAKGSQLLNAGINAAKRPVLAAITRTMGENIGPQLTGAMAGGASGGAVREAGGGPTEQFIASIIGGVGGGLAYGPIAAASNTIKGQVARIVAPRDIQGEVSVVLQRAGIDWSTLGREAQIQLVKDAEGALYKGEALDPAALGRLAEFRTIGATPTKGTITMNPRDVTLEQNLAKSQANMPYPIGPDLAQVRNQNARTVINTVDSVEPSRADPYQAGSRGIETIQQTDDALKAGEKALYDKARDSQGRSLELDRFGFVNDAFDRLARDNKAPFLPGEIQTVLNNISKGEMSLGMHGPKVPVPFNVDTIDSLKTMLSRASRATADGNTKAAIAAVRDALENAQVATTRAATGSQIPITGAQGARLAGGDAARDNASQAALAAFDKARAAARGRRTWQESAPFIEDALNGMEPETWVKRHIINAKQDELAGVRKELDRDPEFLAAARRQLITHMQRAGRVDADTTTLSGKALSDAFDAIGTRKLSLFFSGEEVQRLRAAVRVAKYSDAQPKGSAVNNSNSAAMLVGKLLNSVLNAGGKMPFVGPWVAEPIIGARVGLQARSAASVPEALALPEPGTSNTFALNPLLALALAPRGD